MRSEKAKAIDAIKGAINGALRRRGLEIVITRYRPLQEFLHTRGIELVIDAGANVGA